MMSGTGNINIVGAGDVVANRLVPALVGPPGLVPAARVRVHTIGAADSFVERLRRLGVHVQVHDHAGSRAANQQDIIAGLVADACPVIVATPSDSHWVYVDAVTKVGLRCVVEKPLTSVPGEVRILRRRLGELRHLVFALSYYGLEKALPLSYCLAQNDRFARFLDIDVAAGNGSRPAGSERTLHQMVAELGAPRSLRVDLIEGAERSPSGAQRAWTERPNGLAFETLIHPLIVAQKFAKHVAASLAEFHPVTRAGSYREAATPGATTFLRLDGQIGSASVALTTGKYADASSQRRRGEACFANGTLAFDFDAMTADLRLIDGARASVRVRDTFAGRYAVQARLALDFLEHGWASDRFDDLDDQMSVLGWLCAEPLLPVERFEYGPSDFTALASMLR